MDIHPRNSAVHACQEGSWRLLEGDDKTMRGEVRHLARILPQNLSDVYYSVCLRFFTVPLIFVKMSALQ